MSEELKQIYLDALRNSSAYEDLVDAFGPYKKQ